MSMINHPKFPKPPIIIAGCGRSGTSLLTSVLSAHPRIFAIPLETSAFCPTAYSRLDLKASFELEKVEQYLDDVDIPSEVHRWCEKTPKNILFLGRILDYFGKEVRIINIVRDVRDVILSQHPHNPKIPWVSLERWITEVKAGITFDFHPQVIVVKYEDIVTRFQQTIMTICCFLDEDLDPRLLNWHKYSTVRKHSAWDGEIKGLYADSAGKWRQPQYKNKVASVMSDSEAVSLLKHYGYLHWEARPKGNWVWKSLLKKIKGMILWKKL